MKPKISAEALTFAREHPLSGDENFLIALTEALAKQHFTATHAERTAAMNRVTAEHVKRADADDIAAARVEAVKAERQRIAAILTATEAVGREPLARALAFQSDMPSAAAIAALKTAPAPQEPQALAHPAGQMTAAEALGQIIAEAGLANPSPLRPVQSDAKRLWKSAIDGVNGTATKPAEAG